MVSDEGARTRFTERRGGGDEQDTERRDDERRYAAGWTALRRETVRNALALASALGRILVLPAARCYCDKIWNNLNGNVARRLL